MRTKSIAHVLVAIAFIGFMFLCFDSESMNSFLLSKLIGIILILVPYGLSKILESHININHHK